MKYAALIAEHYNVPFERIGLPVMLSAKVDDVVFGQGYPTLSWYSLLAGMGLFPEPQDMRPPTPEEAQHDLTQIDNLLERSALNYPDQRELLQRIPLRSTEPSLQVYLW